MISYEHSVVFIRYCISPGFYTDWDQFRKCSIILSTINDPQGGISYSEGLTTGAPAALLAFSLPLKQGPPTIFFLRGVRGGLLDLPLVLTAGTLSNSEGRPPLPEAVVDQQ